VPPGLSPGWAVISLRGAAKRPGRAVFPLEADAGRGATYPRLTNGPPSLLFSLAPEGVFQAVRLAADAVGFYSTFAPVPDGCPSGGLSFCDTFRHAGLNRRACTCGEARAASCPMVSGLSSPSKRTRSDCLAPKLTAHYRGDELRGQGWTEASPRPSPWWSATSGRAEPASGPSQRARRARSTSRGA